MSDVVDASSAFQDSLPTSSDALLAQMDDWGIAYTLHEHVPLRTVEDAKAVEDKIIAARQALPAAEEPLPAGSEEAELSGEPGTGPRD